MQALPTTLAAVLLAASGLASAATVFEGGQAADALTFEPAPSAIHLQRAVVRAQGTAAERALDSRSGMESTVQAQDEPRFTSTLSRAEVRREGIAFARADHRVFDGGQSS